MFLTQTLTVCIPKLFPFVYVFVFFRMKDESSSSDEDHRLSSQGSGFCQSDLLVSSGSVCYKKTLRLSSEQLVCTPTVGFIDRSEGIL